MDESRYHGLVAQWIDESFSDVEHEPIIVNDRVPDFIISTPFGGYVIEVENEADELYEGIGQAAVYAYETGLTPVAVFPADSGVEPGMYLGVEVVTV